MSVFFFIYTWTNEYLYKQNFTYKTFSAQLTFLCEHNIVPVTHNELVLTHLVRCNCTSNAFHVTAS